MKRVITTIGLVVVFIATLLSTAGSASAADGAAPPLLKSTYALSVDKSGTTVATYNPQAKPVATTATPTQCGAIPDSDYNRFTNSSTWRYNAVTAKCNYGTGQYSAIGAGYDASRDSWYPAGSGTNANIYAVGTRQSPAAVSTLNMPSSAYKVKRWSYALYG